MGGFRAQQAGLEHKHCGSLHAADATHALQMARDVYTPSAGRREHLVDALGTSSAPPIRTTRPSSSSPRTTRSTATRPSTRSPTKWGTCDAGRDRQGECAHRYLLHLADNALVLGQRNAEWCGHAPTIEEDMSMANNSLDLIGQARLLYVPSA